MVSTARGRGRRGPYRRLKQEVRRLQRDRPGEQDLEIRPAVAVGVARHHGVGAEGGHLKLAGVAGERARADERECLVSGNA